MPASVAAIVSLLSCPSDGGVLRHTENALACTSCGHSFPIHASNVVEILPPRPLALPAATNSAYRDAYISAFEQTLQLGGESLAWGAEENVSESWVQKRRRQIAMVQPLITEGTSPSASVLCDIAAGAGYYTFAYAKHFSFVLHCDLSVSNINYAWQKARTRKVDNIFFLRADYFSPPFRRSIDRILCLDTLIRGEEHETLVLRGITTSLKSFGIAVVDFHNWWHNPLRRLGLLPENFADNQSYSKKQAWQLLRKAGVNHFESFPFYQEFECCGAREKMFSRLLAPTRLLFRFAREL